jgi:hypothetical protein
MPLPHNGGGIARAIVKGIHYERDITGVEKIE